MEKNKFKQDQKVRLKKTLETVTITNWSYVKNMKRYSYTIKEHPETFYFEEELEEL
ncbi:hypothetical protein [Aquibacillus albus]|uniref:Uncharacterized protein n=1 Tax=Aquibacillus albus TaxID=1168171 RepID=A0ABS2MYD5_9BACI|nr:hypothetical protein [Aquibacillus albus]MBM7570891.1 hypothetical protein [Aquibacillus albus]